MRACVCHFFVVILQRKMKMPSDLRRKMAVTGANVRQMKNIN